MLWAEKYDCHNARANASFVDRFLLSKEVDRSHTTGIEALLLVGLAMVMLLVLSNQKICRSSGVVNLRGACVARPFSQRLERAIVDFSGCFLA